MFSKAIELDGKCGKYYLNRSIAHMKLKAHATALQDAETVSIFGLWSVLSSCGPSCRLWSVLSSVVRLVVCGPSCRLWSVLSSVVRLVVCGPSCRLWSVLSSVVLSSVVLSSVVLSSVVRLVVCLSPFLFD
jgi:hypothetical protein